MGRSYTPSEDQDGFEDHRGSCRGKRRFPSKGIARAIVHQMQRRHGIAGTSHLNAYKCKACRKWHVGNLIPDRFLRKDPML